MATRVIVAIIAMFMASVCQAATWVSIENFNVLTTANLSTVDLTNESIRIIGVGVSNPDSCSDPDSYIVDNGLTEKTRDRIFAMLLAAAASQQPIWLYVGGCEANRPGVLNVALGKPGSLF